MTRAASSALIAIAALSVALLSAAPAQARPTVISGFPGSGPLELPQSVRGLEPEARKRWPRSFAGIWIEPGQHGKPVYVAFTEDAAARTAELAERVGFANPDRLRPVEFDFSMRRLERVQRRLVAERDGARFGGRRTGLPGLRDGVFGIWIEIERNRVVIEMPRLRRKRLAALRAEIGRRYAAGLVIAKLSPRLRIGPPPTGRPMICPRALPRPGRFRVPPRRGWNAKELVGMRLRRAHRVAARAGCIVRVAAVDGMYLPVTSDFGTNRVNVATVRGRVVRILGIG